MQEAEVFTAARQTALSHNPEHYVQNCERAFVSTCQSRRYVHCPSETFLITHMSDFLALPALR